MSYRLSPYFTWRERGNIVQQVKRGKSYAEVARFWSRKKRKAISWSTIRSICNRKGVKSIHKKGKGIISPYGQGKQLVQSKIEPSKNADMNLHNINNITEPKSFFQKIMRFLFG